MSALRRSRTVCGIRGTGWGGGLPPVRGSRPRQRQGSVGYSLASFLYGLADRQAHAVIGWVFEPATIGEREVEEVWGDEG
eukprot:3523881-Pyramimonas_sp.AAC.1